MSNDIPLATDQYIQDLLQQLGELEAEKAELVEHLSIMTDLTVAYANKLAISGEYIDQVIHSKEAIQKHAKK